MKYIKNRKQFVQYQCQKCGNTYTNEEKVLYLVNDEYDICEDCLEEIKENPEDIFNNSR